MKKSSGSKDMEGGDEGEDPYQENFTEPLESGEVNDELVEYEENFTTTDVPGQEAKREEVKADNEESNNKEVSKTLETEASVSDSISKENKDNVLLEKEETTRNEAEQINDESNKHGSNAVNEAEVNSVAPGSEVVTNSAKETEETTSKEVESGTVEKNFAESVKQETEIVEDVDSSNTQTIEEDNGRSTIVVKTDVLSPTLSVSTVIPDTSNEPQTEPVQGNIKHEGEESQPNVSAMNVSENKETNSSVPEGSKEVNTATTNESEENADENVESFEDAVEEVN